MLEDYKANVKLLTKEGDCNKQMAIPATSVLFFFFFFFKVTVLESPK